MELVKQGKLDPAGIEDHRKDNPAPSIDLNEVDRVKQEIRETNTRYKEAIQRNKDLYGELVENRKRKEDLRNKLSQLRLQKKKLLGQA